MSVELRTRVEGFDRFKTRMSMLTPDQFVKMLDAVGQLIENQVKRRIHKEHTGPDGRKWAPLSERYARQKAKKSSGGLLEFRGSLLDSIQHVVNGIRLEVGSNLVYAAAHQMGPRSGKTGPKARPYLGLSDANQDEITTAVGEWLKKVLK